MRMYAGFLVECKKKFEENRGRGKIFGGRRLLGEQSADEGSLRDAADRQNHSPGPWWHVMFAHGVDHFVESADHNALQALIDLFGVPEQAFLILHPLEIADRNAAGIGQDVWQDSDSAARENFVGMRRGRAVGSLGDDAGLDGFSVT